MMAMITMMITMTMITTITTMVMVMIMMMVIMMIMMIIIIIIIALIIIIIIMIIKLITILMLPYKAKKVYLSARLKIFILRKTKNVLRMFLKHYLRCIALNNMKFYTFLSRLLSI